jgi:hypothetical protein
MIFTASALSPACQARSLVTQSNTFDASASDNRPSTRKLSTHCRLSIQLLLLEMDWPAGPQCTWQVTMPD